MYEHDYFEPNTRPEDEDHHQLMDALGELMDLDDDLSGQRKVVALASLATALCRWQRQDDWPMQIFIYFAETFYSFNKEIRETILLLLIPQIVRTTGVSQLVWYIDIAIEDELYALLHLSFVEGALVSDDEIMRSMGAYALVELPLAYWKEVEQLERREYLIRRTRNDSASSVRREIECKD